MPLELTEQKYNIRPSSYLRFQHMTADSDTDLGSSVIVLVRRIIGRPFGADRILAVSTSHYLHYTSTKSDLSAVFWPSFTAVCAYYVLLPSSTSSRLVFTHLVGKIWRRTVTMVIYLVQQVRARNEAKLII